MGRFVTKSYENILIRLKIDFYPKQNTENNHEENNQ